MRKKERKKRKRERADFDTWNECFFLFFYYYFRIVFNVSKDCRIEIRARVVITRKSIPCLVNRRWRVRGEKKPTYTVFRFWSRSPRKRLSSSSGSICTVCWNDIYDDDGYDSIKTKTGEVKRIWNPSQSPVHSSYPRAADCSFSLPIDFGTDS